MQAQWRIESISHGGNIVDEPALNQLGTQARHQSVAQARCLQNLKPKVPQAVADMDNVGCIAANLGTSSAEVRVIMWMNGGLRIFFESWRPAGERLPNLRFNGPNGLAPIDGRHREI